MSENPLNAATTDHLMRSWHLSALLDATAATNGERIFTSGEKSLTYAEAASQSRRISAWLQNAGIRRGDRVMIATANRAELALIVFAVARIGAIFVVVNNQLKSFGFQQIFDQCTPAAIFFDQTTADILASVSNVKKVMIGSGSPPTECHQLLDILSQTADPGHIPFPGIDVDPVCLVFTSGSTGKPRGVTLSHDNVRFVVWAIQERLGYRPDDTIGVFLPLSFDYGLYQIFLAAQAGATAFIGRPDMIGPEILKILNSEKISVLPGVPTLFAALLKMLERRFQPLPNLRAVTNTGDKLPQAYVDQLLKFFPELKVFLMFGLTECKRVSIMRPEEMKQKPGSVGRPLFGTEVYAIDENGNRVPPGKIGELVVRGRHVALGYWNAIEETKLRFRVNGPTASRELFSGDSCSIDEDGFIYFYGRNDFLIKHRGFRISPLEIEEATCAIAGVSEAGVVKSDTDDLLHLFVSVNNPTLTVQSITAELQKRLEPVKNPDRVHIIPELPKTMNRKIDRKLLKNELVNLIK